MPLPTALQSVSVLPSFPLLLHSDVSTSPVTRRPSRDVTKCLGCAGGSYLAGTEKRQVYRAEQSQAVRSESRKVSRHHFGSGAKP